MSDLHARLLAEIGRREAVRGGNPATRLAWERRELAYLAALRKVVAEVSGWRHEVVDDCWYTCAAATEEHDGGETCDDARRGGDCDCGLDTRRSRVLAAVAEGIGVEVE